MNRRFFDCITDFIFIEDEPEKADVIFVPGGNYPESAERAAALYLEGYAPLVLPSGKFSKNTGHFEYADSGSLPVSESEDERMIPETGSENSGIQVKKTALRRGTSIQQDCGRGTGKKSAGGKAGYESEWEYLKDILIKCGVPKEAILREDQATFTWENAIYSRHVLEEKHIDAKRAIIVCQAFHARRCYMYYREQFPDTELLICPVITKGISRENWYQTEKGIDTVLGEVERCGSQFHMIMKSKLEDPSPAEHSFVKWR